MSEQPIRQDTTHFEDEDQIDLRASQYAQLEQHAVLEKTAAERQRENVERIAVTGDWLAYVRSQELLAEAA